MAKGTEMPTGPPVSAPPTVGDDAHHCAKGERRKRKIMPLQPHGRQADGESGDAVAGCRRKGRTTAKDRSGSTAASSYRRQCRRTPRGKRHLVGEAADDVPCLRHGGKRQRDARCGWRSRAAPARRAAARLRRASATSAQRVRRFAAHQRDPPTSRFGAEGENADEDDSRTETCNWIGKASADSGWMTPAARGRRRPRRRRGRGRRARRR